MSRKRRKIQKSKEGEEQSETKGSRFQNQLLAELKGYKGFIREKERESYVNNGKWTLQPHELRYLLGKETKKKILELWEKYFGKKPEWYKNSWRTRGANKKSTYIDHFVTKYFSAEDEKKRGVEKTNISELKSTDHAVFELGSIVVPRDIILQILSYFHYGRELLDNLGCVNSSWYITILSNWNSQVYIYSISNLYKISLLTLKSMKNVTFDNLAVFTKEDLGYLFKNLTPERIESIGFEEHNSLESVKKFCSEAGLANVTFPGCKTLFIHPKVEQLFNRSRSGYYFANWYHQNSSLKKISSEDVQKSDLLSSIMPNCETIYNPPNVTWAGKACCDIFKCFPRVKHLQISNENYKFLSESIEAVVGKPEELESYLVNYTQTSRWGHHEQANCKEWTSMFKKLPNLRKAKFKCYLQSLTIPWNAYNISGYKPSPIHDIDLSFFKTSNPRLEELSIKFNTQQRNVSIVHGGPHNSYMGQNRQYRICMVRKLEVDFPSTLKSLTLVEPPYKLMGKIPEFKSIETLELTFENHIFENPEENDVIMDKLFDYAYSPSSGVKKCDILVYENRYDPKSKYVQLVIHKKLNRVWLYGFTKDLMMMESRWQNRGYDGDHLKRKLVRSIQEYSTICAVEELEEESIVEWEKLMVTSVVVYLWSKKAKRVWTKSLKDVFGEKVKYVVEDEEERVKEESIFDPIQEEKWIKCERRTYKLK